LHPEKQKEPDSHLTPSFSSGSWQIRTADLMPVKHKIIILYLYLYFITTLIKSAFIKHFNISILLVFY
jgi:hypothetical protein